MNKIRFRLMAVALALSAAPAHAVSMMNADGSVTLDATDPYSFQIDYNGFMSSAQVPVPGLTSSILFNFLGVTGNNYNFSYTLANTSSGQIDASRLTIFGFNTNPDITSVSVGGGDQFNIITAGQQPNGLSALEICFKDAGPTGHCTGAKQGVAKGGSTSGSFSLGFNAEYNPITLSGFSVRYQGIYADGPNLYFRDDSASGLQTLVPEPAAWAMMITGFGLIGGALRRRRKAPPYALA